MPQGDVMNAVPGARHGLRRVVSKTLMGGKSGGAQTAQLGAKEDEAVKVSRTVQHRFEWGSVGDCRLDAVGNESRVLIPQAVARFPTWHAKLRANGAPTSRLVASVAALVVVRRRPHYRGVTMSRNCEAHKENSSHG